MKQVALENLSTEEKILHGARSALAQYGLSKVRMLESDPAFVLSAMRTLYPTVKDHLYALLVPVFENILGDDEHEISVEQLTHCFVRILITSYLFPDKPGESTESALRALFRKVSS